MPVFSGLPPLIRRDLVGREADHFRVWDEFTHCQTRGPIPSSENGDALPRGPSSSSKPLTTAPLDKEAPMLPVWPQTCPPSAEKTFKPPSAGSGVSLK